MSAEKTHIERHGDFLTVYTKDGTLTAHVLTAAYMERTVEGKTATCLQLGGDSHEVKGWSREEFLALMNGGLKQEKTRKTRETKKVAAPREVKPTILDRVNEVLKESGPLRLAQIISKTGGNPLSVRNVVYGAASAGGLGRSYDPITGEPIYSTLKTAKRKAAKKEEPRKHLTKTGQVLDLLQKEGPLPTREIIAKTGMNDGSTRAIVSRLARTGQIKRGKDPVYGGVFVYSAP